MSETQLNQPARARQGASSFLMRACSAIALPQCGNQISQVLAVVVAFMAVMACSGNSTKASGVGGETAAPGTAGSGGTISGGGSSAKTSATGGAVATGGSHPTGGSTSTGGSTVTTTGIIDECSQYEGLPCGAGNSSCCASLRCDLINGYVCRRPPPSAGGAGSGGSTGSTTTGGTQVGGHSGSGILASGGLGQIGGTTHSNSAGGAKATGATVGAGACADSAKSCVNMPCCSPYECISGICGAPMAPTGGASSTGGSRSTGGTSSAVATGGVTSAATGGASSATSTILYSWTFDLDSEGWQTGIYPPSGTMTAVAGNIQGTTYCNGGCADVTIRFNGEGTQSVNFMYNWSAPYPDFTGKTLAAKVKIDDPNSLVSDIKLLAQNGSPNYGWSMAASADVAVLRSSTTAVTMSTPIATDADAGSAFNPALVQGIGFQINGVANVSGTAHLYVDSITVGGAGL